MGEKAVSTRATRVRGSLLSECTAPGCTTLTMGGTCVSHDPPRLAAYARGRPYAPETRSQDAKAHAAH